MKRSIPDDFIDDKDDFESQFCETSDENEEEKQ